MATRNNHNNTNNNILITVVIATLTTPRTAGLFSAKQLDLKFHFVEIPKQLAV